jgi:hypothetical protein
MEHLGASRKERRRSSDRNHVGGERRGGAGFFNRVEKLMRGPTSRGVRLLCRGNGVPRRMGNVTRGRGARPDSRPSFPFVSIRALPPRNRPHGSPRGSRARPWAPRSVISPPRRRAGILHFRRAVPSSYFSSPFIEFGRVSEV